MAFFSQKAYSDFCFFFDTPWRQQIELPSLVAGFGEITHLNPADFCQGSEAIIDAAKTYAQLISNLPLAYGRVRLNQPEYF